jgi:NTE family protein
MSKCLVLTGGSLRGICAHTGFLKAAKELGHEFDAVIGTSAGAIVGGFYALGKSPEEIHNIIAGISKDNYIDPDYRNLVIAMNPFSFFKGWTGLLRGDAFYNWLKFHTDSSLMYNTQKFLGITVTNISRSCAQTITSIDNDNLLADWMRASSSIPFVFRAHNVLNYDTGEREYYVDGGAVNNIPLDEAIKIYPNASKYYVVTALNATKHDKLPPASNSFLDARITPIRILERVIGAVGRELHTQNFYRAGHPVEVFQLDPGSIHLDEPHKINDAVEKARLHAIELLTQEKHV